MAISREHEPTRIVAGEVECPFVVGSSLNEAFQEMHGFDGWFDSPERFDQRTESLDWDALVGKQPHATSPETMSWYFNARRTASE